MGAGASASRKEFLEDDQPVIKSAGRTPNRSPVQSSKHNDTAIFRWISSRSEEAEENDMMYIAFKEELELKSRIKQELTGIVNTSRGGGSNTT
jgi:hypothetical protein